MDEHQRHGPAERARRRLNAALVDAGNWSVTDSWNVPADAVSGVYLARLQRLDANGNPIDGAVNQIPFIVRNDGEARHRPADLRHDLAGLQRLGRQQRRSRRQLLRRHERQRQLGPDPGAGGFSQDRAYAVSYNRPFITRDGTGPAAGAQDYLFGADYAAIYWLEKNGYDVSYISGVDTDRLGADYLKNYKAFISVGHDEYWSGDQRENVEEARDAGVNLLFWSGNEVYWKTRWEVAYSADGTAYRTLVCYKETLAVARPERRPGRLLQPRPDQHLDRDLAGRPLPRQPARRRRQPRRTWTRSPASTRPATAAKTSSPASFRPRRHRPVRRRARRAVELRQPARLARHHRRQRRQTRHGAGHPRLRVGHLPRRQLRPAGLIKLSETTLPWNGILVDEGNTTAPGVATHNLSLYRTESGALVFGAGTIFWSWALSNEHDSSPYGAKIENVDIQQFTINMFADMGIQPGVADALLISQGLKRATASTDTTAAVASINDLPDTVEALRAVTITGTATDNDGNPLTADGKVAAVEVSVDGGTTWKVANSTDNWATWSYLLVSDKAGRQTIQARAIDDSLNVYNIAPDSEAITVSAPSTFSAFSGATPGSPVLTNDAATVELGMRFAVDRAGSVTELKYWRGSGDANDTDVRAGHLWRADGTLLATVTFTSGLGQAGWQVATLSSPVALTAGTQYIVSYRTNDNYVATSNYFVDANDVAFDGLDNNSFWGLGGVVRVVQDGVGGTNGVFRYGSGAAVIPSSRSTAKTTGSTSPSTPSARR